MNAELTAVSSLGLALFALVIIVLWILLPLAVFGIKKRIDELLVVQRQQLENLRMMRRKLVPELDDSGRPKPQAPGDE